MNAQIAQYVALHRSFGRKFDEQERLLRLFASYAHGFGDQHIKVDRLYEWCRSASSQNVARDRFDQLRRFCLYVHAEDQQHEVPPASVFGRGKRRRPTPYIIEPEQIRAIMRAALDLPPRDKISPHTYHYLFGLLATTGLRLSEALALQREDIETDGLVIRNGKFGKQRLVPIQPSTREALDKYLSIRRRVNAIGDDLFVTTRGRAPHKVVAHIVFVKLARKLGFRGPTGTPGIRVHDLRHTFAVRSLEACSRDREAIRHHIAALSAYLGHTDVAHTYWYLEATPVLLRDIAAAGEQLFLGDTA